MYARVSSTYPQTLLTLSVGTYKGTDTTASLTDGLLGRLIRRLRRAQAIGDRVAIITLEATIRKELAR